MFKAGDIIVCIDDINRNGGICHKLKVTIGKSYMVVENYGDNVVDLVSIYDDTDVFGGYYSKRFVSFREYRARKVKKLLTN